MWSGVRYLKYYRLLPYEVKFDLRWTGGWTIIGSAAAG